MIKKLFFVISNIAFLIAVQGQEVLPLPPRAYVETENGALLGNTSLSRDGRQYFQFLGIPYGIVPERFGPSIPPPSWKNNSPKHALTYGPACSQINEFTGEISGEEDCLKLNVYTREIPFRNNTPSLPVIFVIHLGGFAMGDAKNLGPSYMMDEDVVVVTANYRLGPFGFLNTGLEGARGNQGLKDLVLALKWVNKEIAKFGGDPGRVVVEGSSSGSFAASYLTMSPMAKGLISGAISHSGSALCPWTRQFKPGVALSNAKKLAVAVDCPSSNPSYLVDCLKRLDPRVILEATFPADSVLFNVSYPQFGPSLETYKNESDPDSYLDIFLGQDPYKFLEGGDFNRVPYILGLTGNEGLLVNAAGVLSDDNLVQRLNTEWGRVAPNTFIFEEYSKDPCKVSSEISQFYFARKNISKQDPWTVNQLSAAYSDRWFHKCSRDFAILYGRFAPIYLYNFTRRGAHSLVDHFDWYTPEEKLKPPSHADEIQYLFHNPELFPEISSNPNTTNPSDYNFSKAFVKIFTNFAATGVGKYCTSSSCPEWVTASNLRSDSNNTNTEDEKRTRLQWFQIDDNSKMEFEHSDFLSRMDFWENVGLNDYGIHGHHADHTTTTTGSPIGLFPTTPSESGSGLINRVQGVTPGTAPPIAITTSTSTPIGIFPTPPPDRSRLINPVQEVTPGTAPPITITTSTSTPTATPEVESQSTITDMTNSPPSRKTNFINFRLNTTFLFSIMFPPFNDSKVQSQPASVTSNIITIPPVNLTISNGY